MDGYLAKVGYQLDFKFFQGKLVIFVEDQWGGIQFQLCANT